MFFCCWKNVFELDFKVNFLMVHGNSDGHGMSATKMEVTLLRGEGREVPRRPTSGRGSKPSSDSHVFELGAGRALLHVRQIGPHPPFNVQKRLEMTAVHFDHFFFRNEGVGNIKECWWVMIRSHECSWRTYCPVKSADVEWICLRIVKDLKIVVAHGDVALRCDPELAIRASAGTVFIKLRCS